MKIKKIFILFLALILTLTGCGLGKSGKDLNKKDEKGDFLTDAGGGEPLKIVAGSENKILEPILEEHAKKSGNKIQMTYMGSLEIMKLLSSDDIGYDAVWPASSIWLNMGDKNRILKHAETTSISPVVFGIKKSLAKKLGFVGRDDVKLREIIDAIEKGDLNFAMTSASQSNSGASAYLAFLTSLSGHPEQGLSSEDLKNPQLQKDIKSLLSGVNRSSGSSNWLVDLFLMGDYDAMVNYEQLVIQTNLALEKEGKEALYIVYPVDGLSISDSPLAYIDKGNADKEKKFLELRDYLLSDEAQNEIEKTGKRNAFSKISPDNKGIYKEEWGIDPDRILSPVRLPQAEVISEALNLYQTSFKKPSYTIYVLDYSASMRGEGQEQMIKALGEIFLPENAAKNLLQATANDVNIILPFDSNPRVHTSIEGSDLTQLYNIAKNTELGGGTGLYEAAIKALNIAVERDDLKNYTPAIVLLTDGAANGDKDIDDLEDEYKRLGLDLPIFSIQFGSAVDRELKAIAKLTNARVFDGRKDLIKAFQNVKGYN